MGVDNPTSVVFRGSAAQGNFGQSCILRPGVDAIRNYQRAIDFAAPASHATGGVAPLAARADQPQPFDHTETITAATRPRAAADLGTRGDWGAASARTVTLKSRTVDYGAPAGGVEPGTEVALG
jgi:hypothetical protein